MFKIKKHIYEHGNIHILTFSDISVSIEEVLGRWAR